MGGITTQLFPPEPGFTERDIPSLAGRVFIVTGGNAGVGLEIVKILYEKDGTVYMAGRSLSRIKAEIEAIKSSYTTSKGEVKPLLLDLGDLTTIPTCVSNFLSQESRLDVLFNNAGVSGAPAGSVTAQGHEYHMGVNCLGHFCLTKLLLPVLRTTATVSVPNSVRIIFATSGGIDMAAPKGGLVLSELKPGNYSKDPVRNYMSSKSGAWYQAVGFDKITRKDGIVCVVQSPGTLKTKGWDPKTKGWDPSQWMMRTLMGFFMHEPKLGAYTGLWAGLSPSVTCEDGGRFAIPWGRWHPSPKKDILEGMKSKEEGGTGIEAAFWQWCEDQTKEYSPNSTNS